MEITRPCKLHTFISMGLIVFEISCPTVQYFWHQIGDMGSDMHRTVYIHFKTRSLVDVKYIYPTKIITNLVCWNMYSIFISGWDTGSKEMMYCMGRVSVLLELWTVFLLRFSLPEHQLGFTQDLHCRTPSLIISQTTRYENQENEIVVHRYYPVSDL